MRICRFRRRNYGGDFGADGRAGILRLHTPSAPREQRSKANGSRICLPPRNNGSKDEYSGTFDITCPRREKDYVRRRWWLRNPDRRPDRSRSRGVDKKRLDRLSDHAGLETLEQAGAPPAPSETSRRSRTSILQLTGPRLRFHYLMPACSPAAAENGRVRSPCAIKIVAGDTGNAGTVQLRHRLGGHCCGRRLRTPAAAPPMVSEPRRADRRAPARGPRSRNPAERGHRPPGRGPGPPRPSRRPCRRSSSAARRRPLRARGRGYHPFPALEGRRRGVRQGRVFGTGQGGGGNRAADPRGLLEGAAAEERRTGPASPSARARRASLRSTCGCGRPRSSAASAASCALPPGKWW